MDIERILEKAGGGVKLAKALGVDHLTVSFWRAAQRVPASKAIKIGTIFDLDLEQVAALSAHRAAKASKEHLHCRPAS